MGANQEDPSASNAARRPSRRHALQGAAVLAAGASLALGACGGSSSSSSSSTTASTAATSSTTSSSTTPSSAPRTIRYATSSYTNANLNTALEKDIGKVLAESSNPWGLPAGSKPEVLVCAKAFGASGIDRGTCTFSVKGQSEGYAVKVTTDATDDSANWIPAGTTSKPSAF